MYSVYNLEEIMSCPENRSAIAFLVEAPSHHTVRINITLPEDVLSIVDQRARRLNLSRSAFLAEAALHFGKQLSNNIKCNQFAPNGYPINT